MIKHSILLALTTVLLAGCVTTRDNEDGSVTARLGQTVNVGGPRVTPLQVLEDSRCPMEARCVWAGRVRILVAWEKADGDRQVEITLGEPTPVADGTLTLTAVTPSKMAGEGRELAPSDYRFRFQFAGGL